MINSSDSNTNFAPTQIPMSTYNTEDLKTALNKLCKLIEQGKPTQNNCQRC